MSTLPTTVELLINGAWQDVTTDVYHRDSINLSRGRTDQVGPVTPANATLSLKNKSGTYSPRNPLSSLYGLIGRNTPLRVSVGAGAPWLGCTDDLSPDVRVSTPDASVLDIVGDIDVRFDIQPQNLVSPSVVELGGKFGSVGQQSWLLYLWQGTLWFQWSANGTATTTVASTSRLDTFPLGTRLCVRATLDVNNGASGNTVTFYTAPSTSGPWTLLGIPVVTAGVTSIFNSTAALQVGDVSSQGFADAACRIYSAQILNGLNGTAVANPDFTTLSPGQLTFTDAAGRAWTASSATAITNRWIRSVCEVGDWPPTLHVSGQDAWVPIQAGGLLQHYGQGQPPLQSTLRRKISASGAIGYWPMEDGSLATQAASGIGAAPMLTKGFTFAQASDLAGSAPLPTIAGAGSWLATPAPSSSGAWEVAFLFKLQGVTGTLHPIMTIATTGTVKLWTVAVNTTAFQFTGWLPDGTQAFSYNYLHGLSVGSWSRISWQVIQDGTGVDVVAAWTTVGGSGGQYSETRATHTAGRVTSVSNLVDAEIAGISMGHLGVFPGTTGAYDFTDKAFDGESSWGRISRIASEQSIPMQVPGIDDDVPTLVGPQPIDTALNILQAASDADGGLLYELRERLYLGWRPRTSSYNRPISAAIPFGYLPQLQPTDDLTGVANDVTVSRDGGSSYEAMLPSGGRLSMASPPAGIGPYPDPVTLSLHSDDQTRPQAEWRVWLGTWDEFRYPQVTVMMHKLPDALRAQVAALDVWSVFQITGVPISLAPNGVATLVVEGYSEVVTLTTWMITFNCTPAGPWTAGILDDYLLGRADTAGSQLASSATSSATALSVATTSGPLWAVDPQETPFDLMVSGERVTAMCVGHNLASNSYLTVDASGWSGSNATVSRTNLFVPPNGIAPASLLMTPNGTSASGGINGALTGVGTVTAAATYVASCWVYSPGDWSDLRACADWYDASGTFLSSGIGSATVVPAGLWVPLQQTLTAPASTSQAVPRFRYGGTPASSAVAYASAIRLVPTSTNATSPQQLDVVRAVNGIVKALPSGSAIQLAQALTAVL